MFHDFPDNLVLNLVIFVPKDVPRALIGESCHTTSRRGNPAWLMAHFRRTGMISADNWTLSPMP